MNFSVTKKERVGMPSSAPTSASASQRRGTPVEGIATASSRRRPIASSRLRMSTGRAFSSGGSCHQTTEHPTRSHAARLADEMDARVKWCLVPGH
jgi:hypothetical protein